MKKVFQLVESNKHRDRTLEAIKSDIRKYLKRERKKKLPADATYWEFECRFGKSDTEVEELLAPEIITALDKAHSEEWSECYVEIISKPVSTKEESI
ncbi:MAG: hypothetical protein GQ570_12320 [Helicobacteraceae bacterium]|nr:hypothetical protein [Helicobacteraceae bacterium]